MSIIMTQTKRIDQDINFEGSILLLIDDPFVNIIGFVTTPYKRIHQFSLIVLYPLSHHLLTKDHWITLGISG